MLPISIIIPAFIREEAQVEWLHECVQSAAAASAAEVIVVDDGSPVDISSAIRRNPNVKWYKLEENYGSATARNAAVNIATNTLIFPLDADDLILPAALDRLYSMWDGIPLYPDFYKYDYITKEKEIHQLRDFDCGEILTYCGISSVNVLHAKSQWTTIGGWNENIRYLEDAEYNSRLMYIYCGVHVPEPLIMYRQHDFQKTVHMKKINRHVGELHKMQGEIRRISGMGCCGGRTNTTRPINKKVPNAGRNIPGMGIPGELDDLIKVRYVGGEGKGAHYYRGLVTGHAYKVNYGAEIFVDPRDEAPFNSMFEAMAVPKPTVAKAAVAKAVPVDRDPTEAVQKFPITEETKEYPDLTTIPYNDAIAALNDMELTTHDARALHAIEVAGRNRVRVLAYLKRRM